MTKIFKKEAFGVKIWQDGKRFVATFDAGHLSDKIVEVEISECDVEKILTSDNEAYNFLSKIEW